ncbi:MAG TPA: hypothetical protein VGE66_10155 [Chitinophagaceae bacterium]
MEQSQDTSYVIPARYRQMENMHILFWLVKDISWCLVWKPLGIAMIFPTLIAALVIAWRTREVKSELAHNLAVIFWIVANSYWMISEFFYFDEIKVWGSITGKDVAVVPFAIGILILLVYYLVIKPREGTKAPLAVVQPVQEAHLQNP